MENDIYLLWGFSNQRFIVFTRGRTEDEAAEHALRKNGFFKKGETVEYCSSLPLNAAELYSRSHSDGWLNRKPIWLQKKEAGMLP